MRLFGSRRRRDVVDDALVAYRQWRAECTAVRGAYRAWRGASGPDEPGAFAAYSAALDREEGAALLYAYRMRRAGRLVETGLGLQLAYRQIGFGT